MASSSFRFPELPWDQFGGLRRLQDQQDVEGFNDCRWSLNSHVTEDSTGSLLHHDQQGVQGFNDGFWTPMGPRTVLEVSYNYIMITRCQKGFNEGSGTPWDLGHFWKSKTAS